METQPMNTDYTELRNAQLASYRAEQAAEQSKFKNYTNTPKVPLDTLTTKARIILNEATALNVSCLNLGKGSNQQQQISTYLDQKANELYLLMKQIREEYKFSGRIFG